MKNLKNILIAFLIIIIFAGFLVKGLKNNRAIESTEFLFDTICTITTYSKSDAKAVESAFQEASRIHSLADFFNPHSDVSKINNAKSKEPVTVDPDIMNMLILARDINAKSDGAFDITIAPVSSLWKFNEESPTPPDEAEIKAQLLLVGRDKMALDANNMKVTKNFDETKIDLGGIAKGYAADKAAEALKTLGVESAIIDFGGNIVTIGKNSQTKNGEWRIGLQTPYASTGEYSEIVQIQSGAVVTSGTYQRYFEHNGIQYHHIIDPKTGKPAVQSFDSVTAVSTSAALSDCIATAAFVLGEDEGKALAQSLGIDLYFLQGEVTKN